MMLTIRLMTSEPAITITAAMATSTWPGVVAKSDWEAVIASRAIDATWSKWAELPPEGNLHGVMRTQARPCSHGGWAARHAR